MVETENESEEGTLAQKDWDLNYLEDFDSFKCLGTILKWNGCLEVEINIRVSQAKKPFNNMRGILANKKTSFNSRKNLVRAYILPMAIYNFEVWTLVKLLACKQNAFEM